MDADTYGFIFAFQVLPTIIFFASLMGVLYHLGLMQAVVRGMALAITKVMKVSGAETTSVCASVFIGQRSEEHTTELQSLMRISYAVFCLKTKKTQYTIHTSKEKNN